MAVQIATYRFNVDKYYRLAEVGILSPDEHVELLDGRIWEMHPPAPRYFSVDEYNRMIETGILRDDERVELIEGEIIEMSPIGKRHAACVDRLSMRLTMLLIDKAILRTQGPIRLDDAQVQPDLAVLHLRDDFYSGSLPIPLDTLLLIEVADTTLAYDRSIKLSLYARVGIPEVWLVNLPEDKVEVFSNAEAGVYRMVQQLRRGDAIAVPGTSGASLRVADILGPPGQ